VDSSLFRLPGLLPEGAVLCGPESWVPPHDVRQHRCRLVSDPDEGIIWLTGECQAHDTGPSRLILIHQDLFAGPEGADRLVEWLGRLADLRAPLLPILLHGQLPGDQLVRFFRAGLFDALEVPVIEHAWVNMLIRAERRLELRQQQRLILADSGKPQDLLRERRRELGERAARSTGDLLRAQESLEAANRQLHDAMAELSMLYRFGRELSNAGNWDEVLREILRNLSDFVGARGAALILRSAAEGTYSPRQTWRWEPEGWEKVLVALRDQVDSDVAQGLLAPGVFRVDPEAAGGSEDQEGSQGILALPLEHQSQRLGYLLLLAGHGQRAALAERYLPFLQAVQIVIAEEVAGAQMLDRIRDIGVFNTRVLETVRSAIWVFDDTGRTVYCNRSAYELLTGRDAPTQEPAEFLFEIGRGRGVPASSNEPGIELLADGRLGLEGQEGLVLAYLRDRPDGVYRGEGRIGRPDGSGVPVLIQTSLMAGREQNESWLVMVAEDLRETRKLEAERLKTDRLEGLVEMSATLAHEIRNPLMGLSAQAELLADKLPTDDPKARYISVITREVERIDGTITRMLNFVRPYEPVRKTACLPDLVEDAGDLCRSRAVEAGVALSIACPDELSLELDGDQIKQVLLNLIINGIDATPEGGTVTVTLTGHTEPDMGRESAGALITVTDDGPGFGDTDPAKIFRPFFTTKTSGTGLGLSICQKIIVAHGGDIKAARQGDLTVFEVLLPGKAAAPFHTKEAT
jgi:signal transduction histidine kinase